MLKVIYVIFKYYVSIFEQLRYEDCFMGKDLWCSYNRDKVIGQIIYVLIQDFLLEVVVKVM